MHPKTLYDAFNACGLNYYVGVPDSLLQHFCAFITHTLPPANHVTTANEGNAIGLATGRYLATGTPAIVYMQNSGLGNVVNPIASIADAQVSGIPMVLVVGWRGELDPDGNSVPDEPQHAKMGQITEAILDTLEIRYAIVDTATPNLDETVGELVTHAQQFTQPVALLVRKNTFEAVPKPAVSVSGATLSREDAIAVVLQTLAPSIPIVSTTGMTSRELFELRLKRGEAHHTDFLTVGAMGHTSQIAAGVASAHPGTVVCLDGDGSTLMHLGALAVNARHPNLLHILINNGVHDSVGGQPTAGVNVDFCAIAKACGYTDARRIDHAADLQAAIVNFQETNGPLLLDIRCKTGNRKELGRPTDTPQQNKDSFMRFLQDRPDHPKQDESRARG